MIVEILFIIFMVLWMLTFFPGPHIAGYPWANNVLAWLCVAMLGIFLFVPGLR
jgi:hypothetical protein